MQGSAVSCWHIVSVAWHSGLVAQGKLVRDRIPEIIESKGDVAVSCRLTDEHLFMSWNDDNLTESVGGRTPGFRAGKPEKAVLYVALGSFA